MNAVSVTPPVVEISFAEALPEADEIPLPGRLEAWVSEAVACLANHADADTARGAVDGNRQVMVSLRVTDAGEIQALNRRFRGKDQPTNVLSFPLAAEAGMAVVDSGCTMLGDIVLCAPVIRQEAIAQGKSLHAHWAHMVVHGLLHLHGLDHVETRQAEYMEALEVAILKTFGYDNPYEQH